MDYEVLLGAEETIKRCKPAILIEIWKDELKRRYFGKDVEALMYKLGYDRSRVVYNCDTYRDIFYQ